MATFRALLLKRWRRRARAGEWSPALGDVTPVLERHARRPWSVQVQPRYRHGRGVAIYLARYLRGGPCHASQLVLHPGKVTLLPKQAARAAAARTFTGEAFVHSWLTHVPRLRQRTVRGYGVYAAHGVAVAARNASRPAAAPTAEAVARMYAMVTTCCPHCGQPLLSPWQAARAQAPP